MKIFKDGVLGDKTRKNLCLNEEGEFIGNFGRDLSNSIAYINLINQISPTSELKVRVKKIKNSRSKI